MAETEQWGRWIRRDVYETCPGCGRAYQYFPARSSRLSDDVAAEIRTCPECGTQVTTTPFFTCPPCEATAFNVTS